MTRASAAAVPRATTATAHTEAAKWPKALTAKPGHVCLSFKVPRKANAAALPFHLEATSRESLQVDTGPAGVSEEPCSGPLLFCSWRGMQWRSREAAERYPGAVFPQDQCPGAMWGVLAQHVYKTPDFEPQSCRAVVVGAVLAPGAA